MNKKANPVATRIPRHHLVKAIVALFPPPEWATLTDVPTVTGLATRRVCDVLTMQCYPSRGLHLTGFEIVVDRADWKRQRDNPDKAEAMGRYCTYWNVVANVGDVLVDELPLSWGLIEVQPTPEASESSSFKVKVQTVKRAKDNPNIVPASQTLLAAVMRRVNKIVEEPEYYNAEILRVKNESYEQGCADRKNIHDAEIARLQRQLSEEQAWRKKLEDITGVQFENLSHIYGIETLAKALKFVLKGDIAEWEGRIDLIRRSAQAVLDYTAEFQQVKELKAKLEKAA